MKALVVYYSRTGMTKDAANLLAQNMGCDIEEIIDTKSRNGLKGYIMGGKDAATKTLTQIKQTQKDPGAYDTVIIGTPVWAFTMTPAIRTYIEENKGKLRNVAFFCTEGGAGGKKTFKDMEEICGIKPKGVLEITERDIKKGSYKTMAGEFVESIRQNP